MESGILNYDLLGPLEKKEVQDFIDFLLTKKKKLKKPTATAHRKNSTGTTDQIMHKFEHYREIWKTETLLSSSTTEMINHPAYVKIIALGYEVVPFLLRDMAETGNHWFYALHKITGADPIPKEHEGMIRQMTDDWINWAKNNDVDF